MWKSKLHWIWFGLLWVVVNTAQAASCHSIWPANITETSTVAPTLPPFTGTTPLTSNVTLPAGDYHYLGSNISGGTITTPQTTARLYFNGSVTFTGPITVNPSGNPENLIIIVNGSLSTAGQSEINALIYVTGTASISGQTTINGAVTAAGSISVSGGASVSYDADAVENADFGSLCTPAIPELKLVSPVCGESDKIIVTFDSSGGQSMLDSVTAENVANYSVLDGSGSPIAVSSALLSDEGYEVQLTLSSTMNNGSNYSVNVSNVADVNGEIMVASSDSVYYSTSENGLPATYWGNTSLSGNYSFQRVDSNIDFNWGWFDWPVGFLSDYSIRWEGYIEPDTTGTYQLQTVSEDGSRVWFDDINGATLLSRWQTGYGTDTSTTFDLEAGVRYPVKVEYFKNGVAFSNKEMHLRWLTPSSGSFSSVPNANLYTCVNSFVSDNGIVAYYQLEGPTWNGVANEVIDSSYNGLHGTSINGPSAVPAQVCNGAEMDGTNYIRINDDPLLDLTDQLSITAWIRVDALGSGLKTIFSKDENYEFHINNGGEIFWWWQNSNGRTRSFDSNGATISLGSWHHVAVVYSSSRQSIYLDGVEVAFTTYTNEILRTSNDPLEIGADQGLSDRQWIGVIDEVKLYDQAITSADVIADMNATHPCAESLDHFEVTAANTASVCEATDVTIRAVQSDGSTYTNYTGTMDVSTSSNHGNWAVTTGSGILNPNPDGDDNGAVQYSFDSSDSGVVVLSLSNTHADVLTVTATENGGTATGTSAPIAFSDTAFVISTASTDFIAGRDHPITIEALRYQPDTNSCGLFEEYNGNISLKAWAVPSGAIPVVLPAPGINAPALQDISSSVTLPIDEPTSNNVTLNFVQGAASTNWVTSDVSQRHFYLKDDSSGLVVDENGQPLTISGDSQGNYTVRPFGFYLEAETNSGDTNPAAIDANGDGFVAAGENFIVRVSAVIYEADDDSNNDGVPDAGADLSLNPPSNNAIAASFGTEGEQVVLSSPNLIAPAPPLTVAHPGLMGALTLTSFGNGVGTATVRYDEVGIINMDANIAVDNSYLGSNNVVGAIDYVGRFYPAEFLITDNSPQLSDANWDCDFTYQGQPFGFVSEPEITITAVNTLGATTQNYTGAFWSLSTPAHSLLLDVSDVNHPPTPSACRNDIAGCFTWNNLTISPTLSESNGVGILTTGNNHELLIDKLNAQPDSGDIPWNPALDYIITASALTVVEGSYDVCFGGNGSCTDYQIDIGEAVSGTPDTEIRYGRGWIDNTTGSVDTPLIMNMRLQYWNASGAFVSNTDDNDSGGCSGTLITTSDMQLSDFGGNLSSTETSVAGLTSQPGYYLMSLSAPGYAGASQPNSGSVIVTWLLDNDASDNNPGEECSARWLCYDYDGDGLNENPKGRAIFSALPDNRPILFQRETYR